MSQSLNNAFASGSEPELVEIISAIQSDGSLTIAEFPGFSFIGDKISASRAISKPEGVFHTHEGGVEAQRTDYSKASLNATPISVLLDVPADVADASPRGREEWLALQAGDGVEGLGKGIVETFINGNSATNPSEFDGLKTILDNLEDVRVIDAGGDTVNGTTRVFAVGFARDADVELRGEGVSGVALGIGGNGRIALNEDGWKLQTMPVFTAEGAATNKLIRKYFNAVNAHVGLHIGSPFTIAAGVNIDVDHPPTAFLLDSLIEKITAPNVDIKIIMTRKAATAFKQWRRTLGGYVEGLSPQALNHDGFPILTYDRIGNDLPVIVAD